MAGAAFLGGAAQPRYPRRSCALQTARNRKNFRPEREADAFLSRLLRSMAIDERVAELRLEQLSGEFNVFVLALDKRQPHFSSKGSSSLNALFLRKHGNAQNNIFYRTCHAGANSSSPA